MKKSTIFIVTGLLLAISVAFAAVPNLVSLQGLLRDGAGDPVADGNYSVIFTAYDASVAGSVLWAETTIVATADGLFDVLLGSIHPVPDSLFYDSTRYLGIKVDADPEMVPRQRLSSVGYSFVSGQWNSVGQNIYRDTGFVGIGLPTPLAGLHVHGGFPLGLVASPALNNEDIIIEDDDAVLGMYSSTGGTYGSAIVLGEVDAGTFTNKWGIYRTKTTAGSRLGFSYGADTNYGINPTVMTLDSNGRLGLGVIDPLAGIHVLGDFPLGLAASAALNNEDIVIEDDDAVLGLYSSTGGTYGSAIALGEIDAGVYTNKWGIYRTKTLAGSRLGFSYGADTGYGINPTIMTLDSNGQLGVGVGVTDPFAGLHIREMPMGLDSLALKNENIVIEDDDAVIGLYSGTGGTFGSAIALGELDDSVFTNKWAMYRTKTTNGARLGFSYGANINYGLNPAVMSLDGPNSRMGVGTIAPQNRLDVAGAAAIGATYSGANTAPSNGLLVEGHVGMGEPEPLAGLHIQEMDMGLDTLALLNENIIIEDDDAVIGLYSGTGGTFGSAITLGEITDDSLFTNKWAMYRTKTISGAKLGFSFGANTNYGLNPAVMSLDGPNSRMGVGTDVPQNRLDVEGAAVVGNAYSGTNTAPSNGMLIEGKVGVGTSSVYSDASTNLTLPGSIGFKNGTAPMMYIYESGVANADRPVIAHSPAFADYGMKYDDAAEAFVFEGGGIVRMTVDLEGGSDRLDVDGNVVVGTGTTGCVKDADGTVIAGTCSSDERFKTEIEPFSDVLDNLVQLEPVHFKWRADEFPERNFGTRQSYGLIAQDAEAVMPDLVTEDEEGYLAVRYSKLPLLLLEAVKEQQIQIEQLKAEIAQLRNSSGNARAEK